MLSRTAAALCIVFGFGAIDAQVTADTLLIYGKTYRARPLIGVWTTPDGYTFDASALLPTLARWTVAADDTIEFDFPTGAFRVYRGMTPREVLTTVADYRNAGYSLDRNVAASPVELSAFRYASNAADLGEADHLVYVGPDFGFQDTGSAGSGGTTRDRDGDRVADTIDNCPDIANAEQADFDGDGTGDDPDADDDDDGLDDATELTLGTGVTDPDSDNDGLSDGDEVSVFATDPLKRDSDGDGIDDADEVANGTDPNDRFDPREVRIPALPLSAVPPLLAAMAGLIARRPRRRR